MNTAQPIGVDTSCDGDHTPTDRPLLQLVVLPLTPAQDDAAAEQLPVARVDATPLPPTLSVEQAAEILGCGRTLAYTLARRDQFPCKVLRLGNRYVIPTADLLRVLGIQTQAAA